jgi:hypothetical protein
MLCVGNAGMAARKLGRFEARKADQITLPVITWSVILYYK